MVYDCIIIGTGAAGVSAALTLKALGKQILWLGESKLSRKISRAEKINNYPGLIAVTGEEMRAAFLKHAQEAGLSVTAGRVSGVYAMGESFAVACGQTTYEGKTVVLAVGVETVKPIAGEREFLGRGVSYCATCDGFLYKDKPIAVVSTSAEMEEEVAFLSSLAAKVYLFPLYQGCAVSSPNVNVMRGMPTEIVGGMRVTGLVAGGETLAVDGVFLLKDSVAPSALVAGLKTEGGHVVVDRACKTNLSGLFAAGDCTGRPYQYAKAAGEGNVAAHSVNAYLAEKKRGQS